MKVDRGAVLLKADETERLEVDHMVLLTIPPPNSARSANKEVYSSFAYYMGKKKKSWELEQPSLDDWLNHS